jgi:Protein of unknown function (DUF1572)
VTPILAPAITSALLESLDDLAANLQACPEYLLWVVPNGVSNSIGTLTQHLCGNLMHFIGATLLGTGYQRDRPAEFVASNLSVHELLEFVRRTRADMEPLAAIADSVCMAPYPLEWKGKTVPTFHVLGILVSHFRYHLGQLNYLRRITEHSYGTPEGRTDHE